MHPLLRKLEGGDRRSIGRSEEVASDVLEEPGLFHVLIEGLSVENPIIRMRASDAIEKVSLEHPEYLLPYKKHIMELAANSEQKEVRWHMAQILPRLNLNHKEKIAVVNTLLTYLSSNSSIVNTFVMQAFADIAKTDEKLRQSLLVHVSELTNIGTPAMKARGRKLLAEFEG
jgi:hypothetical protein